MGSGTIAISAEGASSSAQVVMVGEFNPLGGAEISSEGGWSVLTQLQRVTVAIEIGASSRLLDPEE